MAVLATLATQPHLPFSESLWSMSRPSDYYPKSRTENKCIALPSIRQILPELQLTTPSRESATRPQSNGSSISYSSSDYMHSPNSNKRRRTSNVDDEELMRAKRVPRLFFSPDRIISREISPRPQPSVSERWATSVPTTLSTLNASGIPSPVEMKTKTRVVLPSLKATINLEESSTDDLSPSLSGRSTGTCVTEPIRNFQSIPNYDFSYNHQIRYQSHPSSPVRSYERPPFSAGTYMPHYQESSRFGEQSITNPGGDTKQRKRRGNLPKETTDKLRAWFVAHLQHPYPTEDEKQDLMRQTGLQMNQISNWFINARRRQLPAMINNARAESDHANGGRGSSRDGKFLSSSASDYDSKRDALPLSDGESDEGMDMLRRRRVGNMKRGSV